jgi:hypothetical protein
VKAQIVVMDEKDYILYYGDFWGSVLSVSGQINAYVARALEDEKVVKIHIRKWEA